MTTPFTTPAPWMARTWRRFNICSAPNAAGHASFMKQLPQILQCDANYWLWAAQVVGISNHQTQFGAMDPALGKVDPCADFIKAIKKKYPEARFIAYMHPRTTNVCLKHPEWRSINWEGKPLDNAGPVSCLNSPFMEEYLKPYLRELLTNYDFSGFWFDGGLNNANECACPNCQKLFKKTTGFKMPLKKADRNCDNPAWRALIIWRNANQDEHLAELNAFVKSIRPDAVIQANILNWRFLEKEYIPATGYLPDSSEAANRVLDEPSVEHYWHVDNPGDPIIGAFRCKHALGVNGFNSAEIWMPPTCHGIDDVAVPEVEAMARFYTIIANGCIPQIPVGWGHIETIIKAFAEIRVREKYLIDAPTLKYAALVASANTRIFLGRDDLIANHAQDVYGMFRALMEMHIPVDVIGDINLESDQLSAYKVIVLPEAACLSAAAVEKIRAFVKNGGGLIATGRTSLMSADGVQQADFALADVLGAHFSHYYSEPAEQIRFKMPITAKYHSEDATLQFAPNQMGQGMGSFSGKGVVSYFGNPVEVSAAPKAKTVLQFTQPPIAAKDAAPAMDAKTFPALIQNAFGKGKVSYLCANWGKAFFKYGYPHLRSILAHEIERVAGEPEVRVTAPLVVQACHYEQKTSKGRRLVVHLLNDSSSVGRCSIQQSAWPLREEVLPIHDIRIRVKGKDLTAKTVPENKKIAKSASKGEYTEFMLPVLNLYQMVVIGE